jgi:protein-disulfide isomerase
MKRLAFAVSIVVVFVGFFFANSWFKGRRAEHLGFLAQEYASTFVRPHSPVLGAKGARVFIVEFTDPACETCAVFSPIVKRFLATYPEKIQLVIRYAPFHEGSSGAVRVLEAAKAQGKFWETLDLLYQNQRAWTQHHQVLPDRIWQLLPQAGLDLGRIERDMGDPRVTAVIEQDLADATTLGVRKTPGFFVNGKPLEPFGEEPLAALIEAEVRAQYPE